MFGFKKKKTVGPAAAPASVPYYKQVKRAAHYITLSDKGSFNPLLSAPVPGVGWCGLESAKKDGRFINDCNTTVALLGGHIDGTIFKFNYIDFNENNVLVAGAAGSGKSVCIKTILTSLIYKLAPAECMIFIIDPKKVDFDIFRDFPHVRSYAETATEAENTLETLYNYMMNRYYLIKEKRCCNINEYNSEVSAKLPHIYLVFDEVASLESNKRIAWLLTEIASLGRAAGVHLICGTQDPVTSGSDRAIPARCKANLQQRICFRVGDKTKTKNALGIAGYDASKLEGRGDGLHLSSGANVSRFQGAFVTKEEIQQIKSFYLTAY